MQFDFNKNLVVDNLDKVPEDFRGLYVEHEGKYKLATDNPTVKSAVAAVIALNTALNASRSDVAAWKGKAVDFSALSEFGETPEAIAASFREQLTSAGKRDVKEAVEKAVQAANTAKEAAHAVVVRKFDEQVKGLTGQLYKRIVTSDALAELATAKAIAPEVLMPHVASQVRVEEKDGELIALVVTPGTGDQRYSGTTGSPMTIKELVAELKGQDRYKPFFEGEAKRGAGTPGRSAGMPAIGNKGRELSSTEKIAEGLRKKQFSSP